MNEQQRKAMEGALALFQWIAFQPTTAAIQVRAIAEATAIKEALAQDALQALHDENKSLGLYEKGYADAMNWKVQNHLEHLPSAQPEQRSVSEHLEPVAWMTPDGEGFRIRFSPPVNDVPLGWDALYTTPPQRKPLTDEQRMIEMVDAAMVATRDIVPRITRSQCRLIIEAAHGIKE